MAVFPLPTEELGRHVYIPMQGETEAVVVHGPSRMYIAHANEPERVCGVAHRVGYTGKLATDLIIYRLKVRRENLRTVTLPGFYVVEDGAFVEYEQWQQRRHNLI